MSVGEPTSMYAFAGEQLDKTGLLHLRARELNPTFGRFISQDVAPFPIRRPSAAHPYAYAMSNPTTHNDPSGLCFFCTVGQTVPADARGTEYELVPVHAAASDESPVIGWLSDEQLVTVGGGVQGNGWAEAYRGILFYNQPSSGGAKFGYVLNIALLDSCVGAPGGFGCIPVSGWREDSFGFGPNLDAY